MRRNNLPNLLTLFRMAVIPLIIFSFFIKSPSARWAATTLFGLACLTDFFDGYLARRWDFISPFGLLFDPVADKLLVCSTLLMLVGTNVIHGVSLLPAVIILCREILVSGLREFLAGIHVRMPVSWCAKWKTAVQMIALICFLIQEAAPFFPTVTWHVLGLICLWFAAALTLYTGYDYFKAASTQIGPIWTKN